MLFNIFNENGAWQLSLVDSKLYKELSIDWLSMPSCMITCQFPCFFDMHGYNTRDSMYFIYLIHQCTGWIIIINVFLLLLWCDMKERRKDVVFVTQHRLTMYQPVSTTWRSKWRAPGHSSTNLINITCFQQRENHFWQKPKVDIDQNVIVN